MARCRTRVDESILYGAPGPAIPPGKTTMWSPGRGRAWTSASIHASSVSVLRHDVDSRLEGEPKAVFRARGCWCCCSASKIERDSSFSGYQRLTPVACSRLTQLSCAARDFSCTDYEEPNMAFPARAWSTETTSSEI